MSLDNVEHRGARAAFALREMGIKDGAIFAFLLRNEPAFIEALTCIHCLGGTRVLIPWHLNESELRAIMERLQPQVLIGHADLLAQSADSFRNCSGMTIVSVAMSAEMTAVFGITAPTITGNGVAARDWQRLIDEANGALPIPPGSPHVISLTSGSTGAPRVVRWSGPQKWEQWNGRWGASRPRIVTSLVSAPLYFGGQYGVFSQAWRQRANLVILPKFDPEEFLSAVAEHRVNHAYMVPTMFVRMLRLPVEVRNRYDISSLNYVVHTGATCPLEVKRQMLAWWGPIIWESYGTSERPAISACSPTEWLAHPGTVGRPARQVVIVDDQGVPVPPGQSGRSYADVTGMPAITYNDRPALRLTIGTSEFLPTGDIGYLDGDGYLYIAGRADDLINTSRVKVYPLEIENAILQHTSVLDCIVFPLPDPEFGQIIGAIVQVSRDDLAIGPELSRFLATRLSEHKIPARLWTQAEALRAESGKFNRGALARRLERRAAEHGTVT